MNYRIEYTDGIEFNPPEILYKYRDWDNKQHKKVLIDNKLYLASPGDFEDIFDCNVPEEFPDRRELFGYFINIAKKEHPNWRRQERRKFAQNWRKKSPLANPKELKQEVAEWNQKFNNQFGVLSMTVDCANDAMWQKYANDHRGVCFGFDTKLLLDCVGGGGYVQYVDELPTIDFLKDDFVSKHVKNVFFKESRWAFEKEYRLHKMWEYAVSVEERNIVFPEGCLKRIILGRKMSPENKQEIKEIAKKRIDIEIIDL